MAESDKITQNSSVSAEDIRDDLRYIRNGTSRKRARDLIATFLSTKFIEEKFQYIQPTFQRYATTGNQYDDFCNAYLISIFITFLPKDDAEIMLMAYGFLEGFDEILGERRERYWEYAHKNNKYLKGKKRKNKDHLLREVENGIIEELSNMLIGIINEPKQMSDFTNRVYENFSNNKIPKKIPFPITDYLAGNPLEVIPIVSGEPIIQHYKIITFKVSICKKVIYTKMKKIPIPGEVDEEDEDIFDISLEYILGIISTSSIFLVLFISAIWRIYLFNATDTEVVAEAPDNSSGWISEATGSYRNEENSGLNQPFAKEVDQYSFNSYSLPITKPYLKITDDKNKSDIASMGGYL